MAKEIVSPENRTHYPDYQWPGIVISRKGAKDAKEERQEETAVFRRRTGKHMK